MHGKTAALLFLAICVTLAALLLTHSIAPIISGSIVAIALVILGGLSKGFRRS